MLEAVHLCLFYLSAACLSLGWGREVVQDSTSCGSNRVKERNRFLQVSGFVLCLGFLPPTPHHFYTVCMTGNGFLWITSHTKEMSLLFPKSLTFPVAWAGSLQVLPGFESQRQFWLSKVVCPPALYPPFASGVEAGHNSKTGTARSFSSCDNGWQRSIVLPGWLKQRDLSFFTVSQLSWVAHTVLFLFPGHWASYAPNESLALPLPLSEL